MDNLQNRKYKITSRNKSPVWRIQDIELFISWAHSYFLIYIVGKELAQH